MIDMSTPPPIAAFPSQWMKHRALLRKGTSKNIKVFILFRFTEFEKMSPFYKNISVFVYRLRQSDESIEIWVHVKMWSCWALNLCSSLRRNSMGWFFEYIFGITIAVLKLSQNNDNRGLHLCISTRVSGRLCLNHTVQKDSRGVLGTSFRFGPTSEIFSKTFNMPA